VKNQYSKNIKKIVYLFMPEPEFQPEFQFDHSAALPNSQHQQARQAGRQAVSIGFSAFVKLNPLFFQTILVGCPF